MKWFRELLSDSGSVSLMRFMSLMVCIVSCHLAETKGTEDYNLVIGMLVIAFGGKVGQKIVEVKNARQEDR